MIIELFTSAFIFEKKVNASEYKTSFSKRKL